MTMTLRGGPRDMEYTPQSPWPHRTNGEVEEEAIEIKLKKNLSWKNKLFGDEAKISVTYRALF